MTVVELLRQIPASAKDFAVEACYDGHKSGFAGNIKRFAPQSVVIEYATKKVVLHYV